MQQKNWLIKIYNTIEVFPGRFFLLWCVFFVVASLSVGYLYFLLFPITKVVLTASPLMFFVVYVAKSKKTNTLAACLYCFLLVLPFLTIHRVLTIHPQLLNPLDLSSPYGFYLLPIFFGIAWMFNGLLVYQNLQRTIHQEWWIDIKLEGIVVTLDDMQVGNKNIDDFLQIYGEPRTWWEQRIKEPQARAFLARLRSQGDACAITGSQIEHCAAPHREQAERWRNMLNENPPTPQDWKDSGFDFSDKDNLHGTSPPGAPVAISAIVEETEDNTP